MCNNSKIVEKIKQIKRYRTSYPILLFVKNYIGYFGVLNKSLFPSLIKRVYDKFQITVSLNNPKKETYNFYIDGQYIGSVSNKKIILNQTKSQ